MISKELKTFLKAVRFPIIFVLIMWIVHFYRIATDTELFTYGIFPRTISGAKGILFTPFIHSDFGHLASNTFPMLVLGFIIFSFYRRVAVISFLLIFFLTGFSVWLFANSRAYHVGASGVVYGLLSFVFWNGIFRQNMKAIVLALVVLVLYSGYFYGILPDQEGVSWESHLFGGIVGIIISFVFKSVIEEDEKEKDDPWANEDQSTRYFFRRDIFDKTKAQRFAEQQAEQRNNESTTLE